MTETLHTRLPIRIGTRGSPLALRQTQMVAEAMQAKCPALAQPGAVEITIIKTSGDTTQQGDKPLSESGNKGLWTKEIEDALLASRIDMAVHSMKDMPTVLPEGLEIVINMARADVRDAFFSPLAKSIDELPQGAVVGTASLRRQALLLARRPDLKIVPFRGNVGTRLDKLAAGQVDATLLAAAGLERLGLTDKVTSFIEPEVMLPAVAQGALGIETRVNDTALKAALQAIHCPQTGVQVIAERAFLEVLDGSCKTPLACLALIKDDELWLRGLVARVDGSEVLTTEIRGSITDAYALGRQAGLELKGRTPSDFFVAH